MHPRYLTRFQFLASLAAPAALAAAPSSADGRLSDAEVAEILALLHQSRADTLTMLAGLNNAQWKFKSGPDRWSAGEVAEHLMLVEGMFAGQIDTLMKADPAADWAKRSEGKVEMITKAIPDRSQPAEARPRSSRRLRRTARKSFAATPKRARGW